MSRSGGKFLHPSCSHRLGKARCCCFSFIPNSQRGEQPVRAVGFLEGNNCILLNGSSSPPGTAPRIPPYRAAGQAEPFPGRRPAVCSAKFPAGPCLASSTTYWPQGETRRLSGHLSPGLLKSLLARQSQPFTPCPSPGPHPSSKGRRQPSKVTWAR